MKSDQDFKKIFAAHKVAIPDDGFPERVVGQLPERKSILPQAVMTVFVMAGLILTLAIQGVAPILDQINNLMISISRMQAPPLSSVITYVGALAMMGIIGYSVARADAG